MLAKTGIPQDMMKNQYEIFPSNHPIVNKLMAPSFKQDQGSIVKP